MPRASARLPRSPTPRGGSNSNPSLSADGSVIAFESSSDLTGSNGDGNDEIFLAACAVSKPPQDIPTLSQWGLVLFCSLLVVLLRRFR